MMGAGGFIRNPGWEILSGDDMMDEDYYNGIVFDEVDGFLELNSEVVLFLPPTDEELEDDDYLDDGDNEEADSDEDYVPSDPPDDEDLDDDNSVAMSSEDSAPELNN